MTPRHVEGLPEMAWAIHPSAPAASEVDVVAWRGDDSIRRPDEVAAEEPLEIRLAGCDVAVTMRTPGDDLDLAAGFLFTEGIIRSYADIAGIGYCPTDDPDTDGNVVNVNPTEPALVDPARWQRNFFAASSCGVCGKANIDSVRRDLSPIESDLRVEPVTLYRLNRELRAAQDIFTATGGLHAAGLFDA